MKLKLLVILCTVTLATLTRPATAGEFTMHVHVNGNIPPKGFLLPLVTVPQGVTRKLWTTDSKGTVWFPNNNGGQCDPANQDWQGCMAKCNTSGGYPACGPFVTTPNGTINIDT